MKMLTKAVAMTAASLLAVSARSTVVTYTFSGNGTDISMTGASSSFSATVSFDTDAGTPFGAVYNGGQSYLFQSNYSMSFNSGGVSLYSFVTPQQSSQINIADNEMIGNSVQDDIRLFAGGPNGNMQSGLIRLVDWSATALSSNDLPTSFALQNYSAAVVSFYDNSGQHYYGNITAIAQGGTTNPAADAVPEPATWAMMILGFGAIGFGMRRNKVAVSYT